MRAPSSRLANRAWTGTLVPRKTHAPLTVSEFRSTAEQVLQSSMRKANRSGRPRQTELVGAGGQGPHGKRCRVLGSLGRVISALCPNREAAVATLATCRVR